jgi:uncharacterized protein
MHGVTTFDFSRIAQDLQIRKVQVESVVGLLDEGNTVPFITRYRKERTGGLNEEVIRQVEARVKFVRQLSERKQTILKSIDNQGRLTEDLRNAILSADTSKRLEDLYVPFKPKKRTLATAAREKGLEPLALAVWNRDPAAANLHELLPTLINPEKQLNTAEDVLSGVQHILAEMIAETAEVRAAVRSVLWETAKVVAAKHEKLPEGQGLEYKDYFEFTEPARQIPPHRILALNRGEKSGALKAKLEWNAAALTKAALKALAEAAQKHAEVLQNEPISPPPPLNPAAIVPIEYVSFAMPAPPPPLPVGPFRPMDEGEPLDPSVPYRTPHAIFLRQVLDDALTRLLLPSLEREIRNELTDEAETHAVVVFARNLRSLLLQPPLRGRRVLAVDPGFRTGCKLAALDEYGNLLEHAIIYPYTPQPRRGKERKRGEGKSPQPATDGGQAHQSSTAKEEASGSSPEIASGTPSAPLPQSEGTLPSPVLAELQPAAPEAVPAPSSDLMPAAEAVSSAATPEQGTAPPAASAPPAADAGAAAAKRREDAKTKLYDLISRHGAQIIAIGNGTGCRETEELVAELISEKASEASYVIVNEAGASVYSVSPVGREEFPHFDSTLRGTISIGRRLQDPLSELVKIDPQSIGVGLYQHDVKRRDLKDSLEGVVESCVNQVGVDVNTASVPLLRYVSGLNQMVARELVDYRKQKGPFANRDQLLQVPGLGQARFVQAAGFLKLPASGNSFDRTWIHPESYGIAAQILSELGYGPDILDDQARIAEFHGKLQALNPQEVAGRLGVGAPTVGDIIEALLRPGRDPREDLPPPVFKKGILKLEDLQPGMELKGTVLNVVDFGAFVDIGLKDSGLVHISQMANRYIKSPYDVVAVNDVVSVWVLNVDRDRRRVSLTMIKPGTERKPPEKKPAQPRPEEGRRPRGERRPAAQEQGQGQGTRPPRGRHAGPRRGPERQRGTAAPGQPAPAGEGATHPTPTSSKPTQPPRPAHPPRKPRREAPRPKLSQDALEGKVPLRTFGELSALFAAKKKPEPAEAPKSSSTPVPPRAAEPNIGNSQPDAAAQQPPAEQPQGGDTAPP